jgi:tetratricopeptide (TPR) repeat protein
MLLAGMRWLAVITLACSLSAGLAAQDPAETAQRARAALSAGRIDEAVALYRQVAAALPQNAGIRMNIGLALYQGGRFPEAAAELQKALQLDPNLRGAPLLLGISLQKAGQPGRAVAPLRRAAADNPSDETAALELADALLASGQAAEAAARFDALAAAHKMKPRYWRGAAAAWSEVARRARARIAPDTAEELALRGFAQLDRGQHRRAFSLFRAAREKDPALPGVAGGLAAVYEASGHGDWARTETARESANRRPLQGAYREALTAFAAAAAARASLAALPPSEELTLMRAQAAALSGRYAEAVALLRAATPSAAVEKELARVLFANGEYEAAMPLLVKYGMRRERGLALLEMGEAELAARELSAALAGGADATVSASLGRALLALDKPREAAAPLRAALTADADGSTHTQLALALERAKLAKPGEAAALRVKAQKLRDAARAAPGDELPEAEITPP